MAAGCSSSKPTYCTDAANLKTSVSNLGNVDVATNGLSSLQTALSSVQTSASTLTTDAKSAFPSQTAALNTAVSGLATAITSAKGQSPATAATTVVPAVAQVKTSASALQSAASATARDQRPAGFKLSRGDAMPLAAVPGDGEIGKERLGCRNGGDGPGGPDRLEQGRRASRSPAGPDGRKRRSWRLSARRSWR